MNKDLEYQRYCGHVVCMSHEENFFGQKRVLLTRILKLSPETSEFLYFEIGKISFGSAQFQKSLLQLKRALATNPDSYPARVYLAKALFKLEKENEAFCELKKALCIEPSYSHAHDTVINAFLDRERMGDINSFYGEIADMLSDAKSLADLYYGSAEALVAFNKYPKALEMYRKAFEVHEMRSGCHFEYAMALYHEGLFEEAVVQFEHVKRLEPTNNIAFNNTAYLQYCLGRLQKAYEEFEYIIENRLESTGTYSNFILVLYHMDKGEEIVNHYKDLLQQNLGQNGYALQSMYQEALRITQAKLERHDIDEEMKEFNTKKVQAINLVLSFLK